MNLKELRIKKNLKQYELAKAIGVSTMLYSLIETNQCLPTPKILKLLVTTLQCNTADIYSPNELNALKERNTTNCTYNLHGRLPIKAKDTITKDNLKLAGYKSLNHWIESSYRELELEIKYAKEQD